MKLMACLALITSLTLSPLTAHAQTAPDSSIEMTNLEPAEFVKKLRAMKPEDRRDLLESYKTYLENLDAALAQAQGAMRLKPGSIIEMTFAPTNLLLMGTSVGLVFLAGANLYRGAKALMNHHQIVILRRSIARIRSQIALIEQLTPTVDTRSRVG